jgi:hypothetical protein
MDVMAFMLLSVMPAVPATTHAMGKPLPIDPIQFVRCVTTDIHASFGIPESTYTAKGVCGVFQDRNTGSGSTFGSEKHLHDFPWTAEGTYNSSTRATSERITVADMSNRTTPVIESTMQCPHDPWMTTPSRPCAGIYDRSARLLSNDMRRVLTALWGVSITVPYSSLIRTERAELREKLDAQYQAWRASLPKAINPQAKSMTMTVQDDQFTITTPANGDRMQQGQVVVKATPPKVGMTQVTQLEFKWLDAPPNQPHVNNIAVDTSSLLAGYPVPQQVTRGNAGRWEVRARASGKAVPGPWSFPVQFRLFLTQPTQSQKQASPVPQTSPLPSSSVVQPSPVPQTAPAPPSSVMQAPPSSGSATTQMQRSSSMVIPRGVAKERLEQGNQKVDVPMEPEKKP